MDQPLYMRYWGKARPGNTEEGPQYHLLAYHCLDVAAVGVEYIRRCASIRQFLMHELQIEQQEELEDWVAFWLILHDLGKFSEAFQSQREDVFEKLRNGQKPNPMKRYRMRHDSLGMQFWENDVCRDWLDEGNYFGFGINSYRYGLNSWMQAVTGHHGQPPKVEGTWTDSFDRKQDPAAIFEFLHDVREHIAGHSIEKILFRLDRKVFEKKSKALSWWMAGLTVLSDWLGSNTTFFKYSNHETEQEENSILPLPAYWQKAKEKAVEALSASGVLPVESRSLLSICELFPSIQVPSPLQAWAEEERLFPCPQLHFLEDVTGAGKTEAAVILAHRLIEKKCVDGFFIALPTMATANAMYGRIAQVYSQLFADHTSLALAHGQRQFVEAFAASIVPSGDEEHDAKQSDETATARCAAWLADHNKRALLAPAGVGTIDQALLAVLHSKHQSLRLLGLFRKVLVIDEVHACDTYMQRVLEALLEFHARAGGSAILLSATLPIQMKQALLNAFVRGNALAAEREVSLPIIYERKAYPLVTSWYSEQPDQLKEIGIPTRKEVKRTLQTHYVSDEQKVIAAIEQALADGQCVCWMRNTVADALIAYAQFQSILSAEKLILFHARFTLHDRLQTEKTILERFCKESTSTLRVGCLVIATQVAEQSLDADWDFMVSDLAPIDRLIQRAGRLRRHPRDVQGNRLRKSDVQQDERGIPCLWVFAPEWTETPQARWFKSFLPKSAKVYPNHAQLWLTAKAILRGTLSMPEDARGLIESVFGEDVDIPIGLQSNADTDYGKNNAEASIAQQNTVKLVKGYERGDAVLDWWSEVKTPSRLGEVTIEVYLARWNGNYLEPWAKHEDPRYAWVYSMMRVAERLIAQTAEPIIPERCAELERVSLTLPGKGQWSVLLPLEDTPEGWIGEAFARNNDGNTATFVRKKWCYSEVFGLVGMPD